MTESGDLDLDDYVGIARRRWRWLVAIPLLTLALVAFTSLSSDRVYEAEAEVLILTDTSRSLFSASPEAVELFGRNPASEMQYLSSELFRDSVAPLAEGYEVDYELVVSDELDDPLGSDLIAFTARGPDGAEAAALADSQAETYIADRHAHDIEANEESRDQASLRLAGLSEELRAVENELANVRRQIGGATDPQQSADLAVTEQELLARSQVLIDAIETTRLDLVTSVQLTNELDDADSLARIINHAAVPAAPSGPDVSRNLMLALIAGLVLGVGAAISRDLFDRKARDGVALGRELDVPLLGQIRHRDGPPGGAVGTDDGIQDGTHDGTDRSTGAATDAYRGVSNSILLESAETPQALAMTSERPMPGRTIAAVELAQLEASRGLDVLIVDADTADASVAARLGLPRPAGQLGDSTTPPVASPGPTDAQPGTVAGTVRTASPGLDHAEVGQDRLEEDLRSGAFRALLKDIRQEYDLVVFVIPAVLGGGDPRPAAGVVDATIVTYDPSVSRTTEVRRAVEALREARVNVVGLLAMQATASATERLRSGVRARVGAGRRRGRVHPRPV